MTEPCDLDAVDARELIGLKKLSASELLESFPRKFFLAHGGPLCAMTARRLACALVSLASVATTAIIVAMSGWIIPTPFATAPIA